ncbi:MAG: DNA helicase UvrD [Deltaproteobacteria bacterium]|nr:MAG: DNA helicase UvrD [Deltaproteobacteria bacterium]
MRLIADFHVHSHYSVATSSNLTPEHLEFWARRKGIHIIGTGDVFHPGWYEDLSDKLVPAEDGLFQLKEECRVKDELFSSEDLQPVRFILSGEISSIYKDKGRVRKVHNLIMCSSFETVKRIQVALEAVGNIRSDGRPILGISSRDLLEIALEAGSDTAFIPAHIWTPWFSALGAKSGYDTIEECFGDLSAEIFAVETGLSSDPPMNWFCSFLDRYTLISHSDAHSAEKLGREANLFDSALSYSSIISAMKEEGDQRFLGTIEFFPQEGKYHLDGHRKCGICWTPEETAKHGGICPVCGKKVTVGVLNRIMQLADRRDPEQRPAKHTYVSLTPLKHLLAEIKGVNPGSKAVHRDYEHLLKSGGAEFSLLLDLPHERITEIGGPILAEGIKRLRNREVYIEEGYDGKFGQIRAFKKGEIQSLSAQISFFDQSFKRPERITRAAEGMEIGGLQSGHFPLNGAKERGVDSFGGGLIMNPIQRQAVDHYEGPCLILAGPGTGKTFTLSMRIVRLIEKWGVDPAAILAITFTNKAAQEMRTRIMSALNAEGIAQGITITTFHSFGMSLLREHAPVFGRSSEFALFGEEEKAYILSSYLEAKKRNLRTLSEIISLAKSMMQPPKELEADGLEGLYKAYEDALKSEDAFDIDDLIVYSVRLLRDHRDIGGMVRARYPWICIDEYQDINCAQYNLIRLLAPDRESNLFVIGDPDQAIYGFRGADNTFIGRFKEDYPTAAIQELNTSYRCSQTILDASAHVIGVQQRGSLLAGLEKGVAIHIQGCATDKSEAEFVGRTIERLMGGVRFFSIDSQITDGSDDEEERSFSDFCVLFRVSKMAPCIIKALEDHSIPYQLVGEEPFYRQEPIGTIVDLLRLTTMPFNKVVFQRLQDKHIQGLTEPALLRIRDNTAISTLEEYIIEITRTFFPHALEEHRDSVDRLISMAKEYGPEPSSFLSFLKLGSPADTYIKAAERVALMTMHAAKGLEFSYVFIIGCEEGLLPYTLFKPGGSDVEEERRLLYVAMTRAKRALFLSHATRRNLFGSNLRLPVSPFLLGIKDELIEKGEAEKGMRRPRDSQLSLFR